MSSDWSTISYEEWSATCDTLHAHTQILGKLAVALAPPEPQLQHAAPRLTARGWETGPAARGGRSGALVVALDLRSHEAVVEHSGGLAHRVALAPDRPVGDVTREVLEAVRDVGGAVEINPTPQEVPWSVPLDEDDEHTRYDPRQVASYFAAATRAALILAAFRAPYRGVRRRSTPGGARSTSRSTSSLARPPIRRRRTSSCATRWTHRRSPPDGGPVTRDTARRRSTPTRTRRRQLSRARRSPRQPRTGTQRWVKYILDWDDVCRSPDPHQAGLDFARSAFRHACTVCDWDPALSASAEGKPPPIA